MAYHCSYAQRIPGISFLVCQKLVKSGEKPSIKAICAYQYECPVTYRKENTEGARKCRLNK